MMCQDYSILHAPIHLILQQVYEIDSIIASIWQMKKGNIKRWYNLFKIK